MASITSSDGYSNDPSTWPEWVVWPGPPRIDARLGQADGADIRLPDDGTTRHIHMRRQWVDDNLPRRSRQDRRLDEVMEEEWERRHPGIPYHSAEARTMTPDDYPLDDD